MLPELVQEFRVIISPLENSALTRRMYNITQFSINMQLAQRDECNNGVIWSNISRLGLGTKCVIRPPKYG